MRVLSVAASRELDRYAIEQLGLPGLVLMENAAIGLADAIAELFPTARRVVIVCGPGNNGGDGLALARQLATREYAVEVVLAFGGRSPCADCATQLVVVQRLALPWFAVATPETDLTALERALAGADLIIDALYGTGLNRPLEGAAVAWVAAINAVGRPLLAVDVPSGLGARLGPGGGPHVVATATVTFATPKPLHLLGPETAAVGQLVVADLGLPRAVIDELEDPEGDTFWVTAEELAGWWTPRVAESHKGTYGHLLVVAGAVGTAGAAILAARGGVYGGAGLVTVAVPEPLVPAVDLGSLESMTLGLPELGGRLGPGAAVRALATCAGKAAVALGPGLGHGEGEAAEVRQLVSSCPLPLVLDADGLNAFAGRAGELVSRPAATVLTPHPGEAARLLGLSRDEVQADRAHAARALAAATGAVVVLKGHRSLVASPEGELYINPSGNPGMASGGSGDVLTGLLGALLAQGYEPVAAAVLAVYCHGRAGDLLAAERGPVGLAAGDLATRIPAVYGELEGG